MEVKKLFIKNKSIEQMVLWCSEEYLEENIIKLNTDIHSLGIPIVDTMKY